jgi:hypothetical protein
MPYPISLNDITIGAQYIGPELIPPVIYNGITLGDPPYILTAAPSGYGVTARRMRVKNMAGGAHVNGADVSESRDLVYEVVVVADEEEQVEPLVDWLIAAWAPTDQVVELTAGVKVRRGRPVGSDVDYELLIAGKAARVRLVFDAIDPLWYSTTIKSVTVTAGASSGGMVTPMVTPMVTTGTGSLGDAPVVNDGTAPAPWTATLTGGTAGVDTPRLIMGGAMIEILGTIPAGSVLTIDSRTRSVLLNGQPRPWVAFTSAWWEIPPGLSTFSYRAQTGDGTAQLVWRDASH